jgi:hypothetical protein
VIVNDLDRIGIAITPFETHSILVVHLNAVLPCATPFESLKVISGWNSEVLKSYRSVQQRELSKGAPL